MPDALLHVVLTKFRDEVPEATRREIQRRLAALGEACGGRKAGILRWQAAWNRDQRKGYHMMEMAIFADDAAFRHFHAHPAHAAFAATMSRVADWVVGDMVLDPEGDGTLARY